MSRQHSTQSCANFPVDAEGRTYHMGLKTGELANRIVTVGDASRAILVGSYLDGGHVIEPKKYHDFLNFSSPQITIITSKRNFTTVTGRFKGVPLSIVAIGMGMPMMDFFVREARATVQGPMHIIRFGSCGSLGKGRAGDVLVATKSLACLRNFAFDFTKGEQPQKCALRTDSDCDSSLENFAAHPYILSPLVEADAELTSLLETSLRQAIPQDVDVVAGLDVTACSFYSSQGRQDVAFHDASRELFNELHATLPEAESLQMETFQLLHLAKCAADPSSPIRAAAFAMVFAHRRMDTWISPDALEALEPACSRAVLDAISKTIVENPHPEENSLWAIPHSNGV